MRGGRSADGGETSRDWHFRVRSAIWRGFLLSRPLCASASPARFAAGRLRLASSLAFSLRFKASLLA
ncbi:MAG: hypothetical protein IJS36_05150, partial [Kiritimatiellae bacterium]|nr:hypothetical protein [Kiritimatiellia bacterium]